MTLMKSSGTLLSNGLYKNVYNLSVCLNFVRVDQNAVKTKRNSHRRKNSLKCKGQRAFMLLRKITVCLSIHSETHIPEIFRCLRK